MSPFFTHGVYTFLPLLHRVLFAVMLKIFKSIDNVLSHMYKFNDIYSQLQYDWNKITVTPMNYILTSATTPSSIGHIVTLTALLAARA